MNLRLRNLLGAYSLSGKLDRTRQTPSTMHGCVGLVRWPIADTWPTKLSHVNHRSGKARQPKTDVVTTEPRRQHNAAWHSKLCKSVHASPLAVSARRLGLQGAVTFPSAMALFEKLRCILMTDVHAKSGDSVRHKQQNQKKWDLLRNSTPPNCQSDKGGITQPTTDKWRRRNTGWPAKQMINQSY